MKTIVSVHICMKMGMDIYIMVSDVWTGTSAYDLNMRMNLIKSQQNPFSQAVPPPLNSGSQWFATGFR